MNMIELNVELLQFDPNCNKLDANGNLALDESEIEDYLKVLFRHKFINTKEQIVAGMQN